MFDFISNILSTIKSGLARAVSISAGGTFGAFGNPEQLNYGLYYNLYRKNTDLRRVIIEKQEAIGSGGRQIIDKNGDTVENGEAYKDIKAIINNSYLDIDLSFDNVLRRLVRDCDLTGNRYLHIVRNEAGEPIGIQVLDPRYLTVVADEYGQVFSFVYRIRGQIQQLKKENVVRDKKDSDPDNELYGFGIMETLVNDILADNEAGRSNYSLFKNNMVPAQMIILEPGIMQDEADAVIAKMKNMFNGGNNAHKGAVISGVKEIKQIQSNMKDMEFIALRKFTTDKVCSAFGVPKIMLGLSEGVNYSNAEVFYKEFIENTIVPEEQALQHMITKIIKIKYPDYAFEFINNHINQLEQRIDIYIKAIENGLMTLDEARIEIGYSPYGTDYSTQPLMKKSIQLLDDVGLENVNVNLSEV